MFDIDYNKNISVTWGDVGTIVLKARGEGKFPAGAVLRLTIHGRYKPFDVEVAKDITIEEETQVVQINLDVEDTSFCPREGVEQEFSYDITLNPDTAPQTLVGYELKNGPKNFVILPKGGVQDELSNG